MWSRSSKPSPCELPWQLSTALPVSLRFHASLQERVGAPWQESRHQEVPRRAQEHIWVRARKVFCTEAGETGMTLFVHSCCLSAVGGGDLCMLCVAARAIFCLFHIKVQHSYSCVSIYNCIKRIHEFTRLIVLEISQFRLYIACSILIIQ